MSKGEKLLRQTEFGHENFPIKDKIWELFRDIIRKTSIIISKSILSFDDSIT